MRNPSRVLFALLFAIAIFFCSTRFFFFYRDNFSTHYPTKAVAAADLAAAKIPFWNFAAGGGQPLAGNPNTLSFYPDNILYLVFSPVTAFNLHFFIHIIAAFFAMRALARRFGAIPSAATAAALIYVLSGAAVSSFAFYNFITATALVPLTLLAWERLGSSPGLARTLELGAAAGLMALGTEPVTILGTAAVMLVVSVGRFSMRTFAFAALSGAIALAIAAPLLIAYGEIASEVERGVHTYSAETVLAASLRPERLLEMLIGPFLGLTTDYGATGYDTAGRAGGWPPFFPSLLIGAIALPALAVRDQAQATRIRIAAALLLFLALGRFNPIVAAMVDQLELLRAFRYPEKLALPLTVLLVLLVSIFLGREPGRAERSASILGIILLLFVTAGAFSGALVPDALVSRTVAGAILGIATLLALRIRSPQRRWGLVVLLTFLPLTYWAVRSLPIDRAEPYTTVPRLLNGIESPIWRAEDPRPLDLPEPTARARYRIAAAMLDPLHATAWGAAYTFDRSPDGMYSVLSRIVSERMAAAGPELKSRYLRLHATRTVLSRSELETEGLGHIGTAFVAGNPLHAYRVDDPLPMVSPVRSVVPAASIQEAVAALEAPEFDEKNGAVGPRGRVLPSGRIAIQDVELSPQAVTIAVRAQEDALILVNQSYFRAWSARSGTRRLETVPLNIDRLGIVVPAGTERIVLRFGLRHGIVGFSLFSSMLLLLAAAGSAIRSRYSTAAPARYSDPKIATTGGSSDSA